MVPHRATDNTLQAPLKKVHFLLFSFYWVSPMSRIRRSRPEVSCKKGGLKNFTKFTRKHLCHSLFFNKVAGLRQVTLLKKRLWHWCFTVNFAKFLRTPFSIVVLEDSSSLWTAASSMVSLKIWLKFGKLYRCVVRFYLCWYTSLWPRLFWS